MIATGLVFVLGALVATLLALLFVPLLWRNAQRLARRDYAATMPATMNEIRAEVDRVRAEAAVSIRRQEMVAQKARALAARERAETGRVTVRQTEIALLADQHLGEANALRAQVTQFGVRLAALEDERIRLEQENTSLREQLEAALGASEDTLEASAGDDTPASSVAAQLQTVPASKAPEPASEKADEDVVALRERLEAPLPSNPAERERENEEIRERISALGARVIDESIEQEGPGSPLAAMLNEPEPAGDPELRTPSPLAARVRRIRAGRATASTLSTEPAEPAAAEVPERVETPPATVEPPAAVAEVEGADVASPEAPARAKRSRERPRRPSTR